MPWQVVFFFPRNGDLYSQPDLHKLTSYKIVQIKSREQLKTSVYCWVWWEADAGGGAGGVRRLSAAICAARGIQRVRVLQHQEAEELPRSVTGIVLRGRR